MNQYIVDYELIKCAMMHMARKTYSEKEAPDESILRVVEEGSELVIVKWLEDMTGKTIQKV